MSTAPTVAGHRALTGSVDNLTVAEQAAQFGIRLTFRGFLTASAPITLASLAILIARIDD